MKPARRFRISCHKARPFPGFTVITPPGDEDEINKTVYSTFADAWEFIVDKIGDSKFVPAPKRCWHMTVADLISKRKYVRHIKESGRENDLKRAVAGAFSSLSRLRGSPLKMSVTGISFFDSLIIAVIECNDDDSYRRICDFREGIYRNSVLNDLGILPPKYKYTFHITLAYLEDYLTKEEGQQLATIVGELNQKLLVDHLVFLLSRVDLRKFDDMSLFYRRKDWPWFCFA